MGLLNMKKDERTLEISESRMLKISYGALVGVLAAILGFGGWMANIYLSTTSNTSEIQELKAMFRTFLDKNQAENSQSNDRLARIETYIKLVYSHQKRC